MSKEIICISNNMFDQRPWTNRQRCMEALRKKGYKIIFIEPPKSIFFQFAKLIFRKRTEQKVFSWFLRLFKAEKREDNLFIISLIKYLPLRNRQLRKLNYRLNRRRILHYLKKEYVTDPIVWVYSPDGLQLINKIDSSIAVYDCLDEYTAQPYYNNSFNDIDLDEIELLEHADLVFACSEKLSNSKKIYNNNTFFVPNAADYSHFSAAVKPDTEIPGDLKKIPEPRIGFVGALDTYKLDIDMLADFAKRNPQISVALIGGLGEAGKSADFSEIKTLKNFYFLGKKDYSDLPSYLKGISVGIIPYVKNEYTKNFHSPLKLFEYLGAGLFVVASGIPEVEEFKDVVFYTEGIEDFEKTVTDILKGRYNDNIDRTHEIAKEYTWDKKVSAQLKIIEEFKK